LVPFLSGCLAFVRDFGPGYRDYHHRWPRPAKSSGFVVYSSRVQGMARVRSGQAPAWPLSSGRSAR